MSKPKRVLHPESKDKKYNTIKEFLETCSEDEQNYIYDLYFDCSVDELIEIIFCNLPPDEVIAEIMDYRREVAEETD